MSQDVWLEVPMEEYSLVVVEENKLEDGDETIDEIFGILEQAPKLTNESRAQC